jgi:tRNA A-37 threonylcarbamoyl transferase component Bud32
MMGATVSGQADPTGEGVAIGHLAIKQGLLTPEQLREALIEQSKSGIPSLETILLTKGLLTADQLRRLHSIRETTVLPSPPVGGPDAMPATLGKYRLVREAGRGAMARVFEAFDPALERKVALKVVSSSPNAHPEEAALDEQRFLREARVMANLPKHPHIVGVYDAGVVDGMRYLAMEFVDGVSMQKWGAKGTGSMGRWTTILRDVALAVHHAHEHGVIHRDLKPANILVDADGRPHVMDFGLAKLVGQSVKASYTEGGLAVGTPAYMSPEQASGIKTVDRRTDVYSMGVMLYEILTGRLPFVGSSPMEVMVKTSKDPVVPPSKVTTAQLNPVHFKTLESVCLKALAKDPADRYATAEQFAEDLTRWLRGQDFRVSDPRLARRAVAIAAAAVLAILAGGALGYYRPWQPSNDAQLAQADRLLAEGKPEEALALYGQVAGREKGNARAEAGRQSALLKIREKTAPPPPPPPPEDPWKKAVQILPTIQLAKDVVSGTWAWEGDALVTSKGSPARVQFPYHPPEEYDVRVTFVRQRANYCVNLILTKSGQPFTLVMENRGVFGFERIRGADFQQNSTVRRLDRPLQPGTAYTVLVEVRETGVKTYMEGEPISELKTYAGVTMNPDWVLPDPFALGVGAWNAGAAIRSLEVRDVTGKGRAVRKP